MEGRMGRWTNGQVNGRMDGWLDGWTDRWKEGRMEESMAYELICGHMDR